MLLAASSSTSTNFVSFDVPAQAWVALVAAIIVLLLVDLFVFHRGSHEVSVRAASVESAIWIAIGLGFTGVMAWWHGGAAAGEYIAGYLIEKSLSVDNVFVWAVIFAQFGVPPRARYPALFWGVFGALVLRAIFIFAGVSLLENFDFVLYVFGALLLFTAYRVARETEKEIHPEQNPVFRLLRRAIPATSSYHDAKFFVREHGRLLATPLFFTLVLIELTDVVFAVDSVPAVLAVSREPFIVFASNAFAILGLRALYFVLSDLAGRLRHLNIGLAVILAFVGVKMMLVEFYHVPTWFSLVFIAVVLAVTTWVSLRDVEEIRDTDADTGADTEAAG